MSIYVKPFTTFNPKDGFETEFTEAMASKLRTKFPDKIPVILQMDEGMKSTHIIEKTKFLVDTHLPVGQFHYLLRKHLRRVDGRKDTGQEAIFLLYGDPPQVPRSTDHMIDVFQHNNRDGFLFAKVLKENTFGF